jgi:hypothetical protein
MQVLRKMNPLPESEDLRIFTLIVGELAVQFHMEVRSAGRGLLSQRSSNVAGNWARGFFRVLPARDTAE